MTGSAYLESQILSADPIELIRILYEHAIIAIDDSRRYLQAGDIAARSRSVSRCISILGELKASLNHEGGGALSGDLARLYDYMQWQLTLGNVEQRDEPFASVETILKTLAEGWTAIDPAAFQNVHAINSAEPRPGWSGCLPRTESEGDFSAHSWCA